MKRLGFGEVVAAAYSELKQLPLKLKQSANGAVYSGYLSGGMIEQEGLEAYEECIERADNGLRREG